LIGLVSLERPHVAARRRPHSFRSGGARVGAEDDGQETPSSFERIRDGLDMLWWVELCGIANGNPADQELVSLVRADTRCARPHPGAALVDSSLDVERANGTLRVPRRLPTEHSWASVPVAANPDLRWAGIVELLSNDPTIEIIGQASSRR
jgi:hypothetical protein